MFGSKWHREVLTVKCPVCKCGNGHFCRDQNGKCLAMPHRERRQEAMRLSVGAVMPERKSA
jgi:hypothetical protein